MSIKPVKTDKFPSGRGYKLDWHRRGHKRVRQIFESRKLAQAVEDKLSGDAVKREHGLPVESGVKLGALVKRHLERMKERGRDKKNTTRAETVLNRFLAIVGKDTLVEKIRRSDIRRYVELREKTGIKPQSINREVNEIKACLRDATIYYASLEDWEPPRGVWLPSPTEGRRQTWDAESDAKVLAELFAPRRGREQQWQARSRRDVGEMFIIMRRTGMRPGEVRTLRKAQVDLKAGVILITSKKGMTERRGPITREVPVPDDVLEILKRRVEEAKGAYLFPGDDPHKPRADYRNVLKHACERAGVAYGYQGLTMYDARRTAENEMLEDGHSPRAVGDTLGHSVKTMVGNYLRSTREQRRRAVESAGRSVHRMATPEGETSQSSHFSEEKSNKKKAAG